MQPSTLSSSGPTGVRPTLAERINTARLTAEAMDEHVKVTTELEKNAPSVFVDRSQMELVLRNLVSNAGGRLEGSSEREAGRVPHCQAKRASFVA